MIESLVSAYGPIGFGLVALLILWRAIVAPELQTAREQSARLGAQFVEAAKALQQATAHTTTAAERLIEAADQIETRHKERTKCHDTDRTAA